VVEDGRITELGPHNELVAAGGPYAGLWGSWHGDAGRRPAAEHGHPLAAKRSDAERRTQPRRSASDVEHAA
jgi:hypothetical protein